MPFVLLWAQAGPNKLPDWIQWLYVWGDPQVTDNRWFGGPMTWAKFLGLICLLCWLVAQFITVARGSGKLETRRKSGPSGASIAFAAYVGLAVLTALLATLERNERIVLPKLGSLRLLDGLVLVLLLGLVALIEWVIWSAPKKGERGARSVLSVLLHAALGLGYVVTFLIVQFARRAAGLQGPLQQAEWMEIVIRGTQYGATYAGLVVLIYLTGLFLREVREVRWRRLYTIAWHTVVEAFRRMWAPWVVLAVFVVILAFMNWFLGNNRTAELARLFVSSLSVVTTVLLMLMVVVLAPISIPNDIRQQTIFTVVSKPVRRLELIWGRLLGFMALVTVILLAVGLVNMGYLKTYVWDRVASTRNAAREALREGRVEEARRLDEQAGQLATRMSARVPVYGSLAFVDSRGKPRQRGVDVGQEQVIRSHIEGASPAKATWRYDVVPDPGDRRFLLDRRLNVNQLLQEGTIEHLENRLYELRAQDAELEQKLQAPDIKPPEMRAIADQRKGLEARGLSIQQELAELQKREQDLRERAREARGDEASRLRAEADALRSRPIPVEMVFNIFRTTKGVVGEAVRASMVVSSPSRPDLAPARDLFPVPEYYTIRRTFPARMLVGSQGRLNIDIQCITPSQFIGMAEKDLYILTDEGSFWTNYLRGLSGIWLQALVVVSVGLFAGTFLSWPVALVLTLAAWLGGQVFFGFLDKFSQGEIAGGGPFEALIRLITHENLTTELAPTPGVIVAKTFDLFFTPIMSRLVYVVPNLNALDVSETVASGFAVTNSVLFQHVLLALGYALPFTVAAFYILKNREVAA